MAATIRGTFELIDRASRTLEKIERQALKTQAAVEGVGTALDAQSMKSRKGAGALEQEGRGLRTFEQDLKGARQETTRLTRAHDDLGRRTTQSGQSFSRFQRVVRSVRADLQGLNRDHTSLLRGLARVGGAAGVGFALGGPLGGVLGGIGGAASNAFSGFGQFLKQSENAKVLKGAVKDVRDAFDGLGSSLMALKIPMVVSAIGPLISAVDALGGGLIALLPKLAQAGGAMFALPAAAGVAAQAFGTLKLAMSGVSQALQAADTMQNQWALNQQQWQQQVIQASDAVRDAQMRLNDAFYSERQAQLNLIIARRQATRQLQDMAFAAHDAILKEARAGLTIQQARQQLQQAMMTPGTSQLQLESDRLAVLEAQASAQKTHTEAVRSRVDYSRALRRDPTSEPVMKVANAQHQVAVATFEVARAQKGLQRSLYELHFLWQQGNAGVAAYKKALMDLGPSARAFVKFLTGPVGPDSARSIVSQIDGLKNAAAGGLFPKLHGGVMALVRSFGPLRGVLHATGQVLGRTLSGVMKVFLDPKWIGNVGQKNAQIIGVVGQGFVALARALKALITAGQPFIMWLATLFRGWAQHKAALYETHKGFDALTDRLNKAKAALTTLFGVLKNIWGAFKNVLAAATPLGNWLWGQGKGSQKGHGALADTLKWKEWTQTHGKAMTHYFNNLKGTLSAIARLFDAIVKAFVHLGAPGQGGQSGAQLLANTLTKLTPVIAGILQNTAALLPIFAQLSGYIAAILGFVAKIVGWMLRWKPLAAAVAGLFAAGVLTRFFGKMFGGLTLGIGLWHRYREAKRRALEGGADQATARRRGLRGLFSPGTSADLRMGERPIGRPGSFENPLVVKALSAGSLPSSPSDRNSPMGGGVRNAEHAAGDVAKTEGEAAKLSRLERAGAFLGAVPGGRLLTKLLGRGPLRGLAGGAEKAVAGEVGALGSEVGKFAKFGRILGPLGLALTALPGVLSFFGTKGSFGTKAAAAANATVSSLTFGLINPNFGGPSIAQQRAQGTSRADVSFSHFQTDRATGLLTARGEGTASARLAQLQRQLKELRNPPPTHSRLGNTIPGVPDKKVIADRIAQIGELHRLLDSQQIAKGDRIAAQWNDAFAMAMDRGVKPKLAMRHNIAGIALEMATLRPKGKTELLKAQAEWGAQLVRDNPKLQAPVDALNAYIVNSFKGMGQSVQVVNGQILTGSQQQWEGVYTALTDPIQRALLKQSGLYKQIEAKAVGELMTMGLTRSDARMLLKNPQSANQWVQFYQHGATGGGHGTRNRQASGGRVMGSNPRDVYQLGNNMVGGGELVMNRWQEMDTNARLMRHGEPTVGSIVANRKTPHWYASGGRLAGGGYVFPFPGGEKFQWERIDQGQDLLGPPGGPVLAIGPGVVSVGHDAFSGFGPSYPIEQMSGGPLAGQGVYYGHTKAARTGPVNAGEIIAYTQPRANDWTAAPAGWLEIGLASALGHGVHGQGAAIAPLLHGLAAGHMVAGTGMTGGPISLSVPKITGLGGIPLVLAQAAASSYANNLSGALNAALGTGGLPTRGGGTSAQNQALGRRMMMAFGWGADQWPSLQALWSQESGWSATALNKSSGAFGIPQSLPANKMASAGADWQTNPATQIKWGLGYIKSRYGSPAGAEAHERNFNWYAGGGRLSDAGWFGNGGSFVTNGPTLFGAGEGGRSERVTVEPAGGGRRPVHIEIHKIEVNRKGDVKRIVDEEMRLLAASLDRRA